MQVELDAGARRDPGLLRDVRPSRHLRPPRRARWRWPAPTWWTRAPTPRRTASRRRRSGSRTTSGKPYEKARLSRLRDLASLRTLNGEIVAAEALRDRDQVKKRERDFIVPTRITFDNTGSDIYTIIEVETRDRPGLLHDLARTLTANNVSIAWAIIATYGEQAVDVFYVKDLFGLKLHAEAKRGRSRTRLRAAIEHGPPDAETAARESLDADDRTDPPAARPSSTGRLLDDAAAACWAFARDVHDGRAASAPARSRRPS